jgi:hypothetical protein
MEWIWLVAISWCVLAPLIAILTGCYMRWADKRDADASARAALATSDSGSRAGRRSVLTASLRILDKSRGPSRPDRTRRSPRPAVDGREGTEGLPARGRRTERARPHRRP